MLVYFGGDETQPAGIDFRRCAAFDFAPALPAVLNGAWACVSLGHAVHFRKCCHDDLKDSVLHVGLPSQDAVGAALTVCHEMHNVTDWLFPLQIC